MSFYILLFNMERSVQRIRPPDGTMTLEQIASEEEARRLALDEHIIEEILSSLERIASPSQTGRGSGPRPLAGNCFG